MRKYTIAFLFFLMSCSYLSKDVAEEAAEVVVEDVIKEETGIDLKKALPPHTPTTQPEKK